MTRICMAFLMLVFLASCGVDGAPTRPEVTSTTKIGYNSKTGSFSKTIIGVEFDL
jgi:hypothetical protein